MKLINWRKLPDLPNPKNWPVLISDGESIYCCYGFGIIHKNSWQGECGDINFDDCQYWVPMSEVLPA